MPDLFFRLLSVALFVIFYASCSTFQDYKNHQDNARIDKASEQNFGKR